MTTAIEKDDWIEIFVKEFKELTGTDDDFAQDTAEAAYEACPECDPKDAVGEELSYWEY